MGKVVTISIDEDLLAELDALAAAENRNRSSMVRELIRRSGVTSDNAPVTPVAQQ